MNSNGWVTEVVTIGHRMKDFWCKRRPLGRAAGFVIAPLLVLSMTAGCATLPETYSTSRAPTHASSPLREQVM
jgi:hypothetical protein